MDGPENYNLTGNQMQALKPEDQVRLQAKGGK